MLCSVDRMPQMLVGETEDDLIIGGYRIFQSRAGYRFSLDAVLLAHFPLLKEATSVLDIGTGNGVIALILSVLKPELNITGVEVQASLAERARRNVRLNGMESRIHILRADIRKHSCFFAPQSFDLLISNPPFFKVGSGEMSSNLEKRGAHHELTLTLEQLLAAFKFLLAPQGRAVLIHRAERWQDIMDGAATVGLQLARYQEIKSRRGQEARLYLLEMVHAGLAEEPIYMEPLVIYTDTQEYAEQIRSYYQR